MNAEIQQQLEVSFDALMTVMVNTVATTPLNIKDVRENIETLEQTITSFELDDQAEPAHTIVVPSQEPSQQSPAADTSHHEWMLETFAPLMRNMQETLAIEMASYAAKVDIKRHSRISTAATHGRWESDCEFAQMLNTALSTEHASAIRNLFLDTCEELIGGDHAQMQEELDDVTKQRVFSQAVQQMMTSREQNMQSGWGYHIGNQEQNSYMHQAVAGALEKAQERLHNQAEAVPDDLVRTQSSRTAQREQTFTGTMLAAPKVEQSSSAATETEALESDTPYTNRFISSGGEKPKDDTPQLDAPAEAKDHSRRRDSH